MPSLYVPDCCVAVRTMQLVYVFVLQRNTNSDVEG